MKIIDGKVVIETGTGNCHIFVDATADLSMAVDIIIYKDRAIGQNVLIKPSLTLINKGLEAV